MEQILKVVDDDGGYDVEVIQVNDSIHFVVDLVRVYDEDKDL
jgi:hypothetical protein